MFRHALNPAGSATAPTRSWWAVHVASLTPILLAWKAARVTATLYTGDRAAVDVDDLAAELATFHPSPGQLTYCATPPPNLPEYLVVFDGHGEHPGIWRTQDPQFIINAATDTELRDDFLSIRPGLDLPGEGWAYWWIDAAEAFEILSPAFMRASAGHKH